jgi:hypothetical protein
MKRPVLLAVALSVAALASGLVLMTASSVAAGSLPTLTLKVTKNTVIVGGAKVSGAVNIVSTVTGEGNDSPGLVLLKPGVTPAELGKAVSKIGGGPLDAIDPYATIVFDGYTNQGTPTTNQVVLQPGTYIAVNNGNAFTPFTVTPAASPASLPKPAATVTAIDFAFKGASTLRQGELVRFENDGYLIHMFLYAKVKSVANAKKAEALLLAGKANQATKKYGIGPGGMFAGPLSHGALQQQVITQAPGVYVIACAMNAQDGRLHFQLGMFRTIRIVK